MARTSDEPSSERGPLQQEVQISRCTRLHQVRNVTFFFSYVAWLMMLAVNVHGKCMSTFLV